MRSEWVRPMMYVKLLSAEYNCFLQKDFNMVVVDVNASSSLGSIWLNRLYCYTLAWLRSVIKIHACLMQQNCCRSIAFRETLNRSVLNQKKREVDSAFPGKATEHEPTKMCHKCTTCGRTALRIRIWLGKWITFFDWIIKEAMQEHPHSRI